ncbi:MAG: YbhB/YbcL family Raf kinase inhibitor-like protein [Patescibacteria group bacterium]
MQTLNITSEAFEENGVIPVKYTCDGVNISPPLEIGDLPAGAQSMVLIMDDPDIPDFVKQSMGIEVFDHWVIFNIPSTVRKIEEGIAPEGISGVNSKGQLKYTGPCPPDREHRYFFKIHALNLKLNLSQGASKKEVEKAIEGHIIASGELVGRYSRIR